MQESNKVKPDEFQVGDTVWCTARGKGVVEGIHTAETYPVVVYFDNGDCETYTADGRISTSDGCPRTLFFSEPKIEASVVRPLCEPSGQASCPSAFVPTLVGKRVAVQEPACHDIVINISWEDQNKFGNDNHAFDKEKCVAFEVSNENLLK